MKKKQNTNANSIIAILFLLLIVAGAVLIASTKLDRIKADLKSMGGFRASFEKAVTSKDISEALYADIETVLNKNFPGKNFFIDINGLTHRLLLQREMNGVILLKNGHEHIVMDNVNAKTLKENAEDASEFSAWLNTKGIPFVFCQVPQKLVAGDCVLPKGLTDYANSTADSFLSELNNKNIPYLDLRASMKEDGVDPYSLFLKTEHHWTAEGGFYAFQKLCQYIKDNYGEEIPDYAVDPDNYITEKFEKASLGIFGQRTGCLFAGYDDYSLMYPAFETSQTLWVPHKKLLREGSFKDAVFKMDYFNEPLRTRGLYDTYIGGNWPVVIQRSDTAEIDKTLLLLIDSYGTVPEAFFTAVYKNVIALDLRWVARNNLGKTAVDYVEEFKPDLVIQMLNPNQIGNPFSEQFDFGVE